MTASTAPAPFGPAAWLNELTAKMPDDWTADSPSAAGDSFWARETRFWTSPDGTVTLTATTTAGSTEAVIAAADNAWAIHADSFPPEVLIACAHAATGPDASWITGLPQRVALAMAEQGWTIDDEHERGRLLPRTWTSPDQHRSISWCLGDQWEPGCFFVTRPRPLIEGTVEGSCGENVPLAALLALI